MLLAIGGSNEPWENVPIIWNERLVVRSRPLLLFLLFVLIVPFSVSCCSSPDGPEPVENLKQLVDVRVEQWLDPRMDAESWQTFHSQQNVWENSPSLAALSDWFVVNLGQPSGVPELWDFASFIQELKGSELFTRGPPSDAELLQMLIEAMRVYKFEE